MKNKKPKNYFKMNGLKIWFTIHLDERFEIDKYEIVNQKEFIDYIEDSVHIDNILDMTLQDAIDNGLDDYGFSSATSAGIEAGFYVDGKKVEL